MSGKRKDGAKGPGTSKAAARREKWAAWREGLAKELGKGLGEIPEASRAAVAAGVAGAVCGLLESLAKSAATAAARAAHEAVAEGARCLALANGNAAAVAPEDGAIVEK